MSPDVLYPIEERTRIGPVNFGSGYQSSTRTQGVLDPTQEPFNADPTGATDSTHALRFALDFARRSSLAVRLPVGTYMVSDELAMYQTGTRY